METRHKIILAAVSLSLSPGLAGCDKGGKDGGDGSGTTAAAQTAAQAAEVDPAEAHKVVELAAGYHNSVARLKNGKVRVWGQGQKGELGNGKNTIGELDDVRMDAATPAEVKGIDDAVFVAAGHAAIGAAGSTICAITEGKKTFCWGDGGLIPLDMGKERGEPVEVPALQGASEIAMGIGHACALMDGGKVHCWGSNYDGQIGIDDGEKRKVKSPTEVPGISGATDIASGSSHVCALVEGGKVKCWGDNGGQQVLPGAKDKDKILAPVDVPGIEGAVALGANDDWSCAILSDKRLSCWGERNEKPMMLSSDVEEVTGLDSHMCLRKTNGTVHCWGKNDVGQIGNGTPRKPYSADSPIPVQGLEGKAVDLAVGYDHSCAAMESGEVFCWGENEFGELGNATLIDSAKPVAVANVSSPELPEPNPALDKVPQGSIEQSFEDLPDGCEHTGVWEGSYEPLLRDKFTIESAWAKRSKRRHTVTVTLANYHLYDKQGRYPKMIGPRGDQLKTVIYIKKVDDPEADKPKPQPVDKGSYVIKSGDYEREISSGSSIYNNHQGFNLYRGAKEGSALEVTHSGDEWVCGKISLENKYGKLEGPFAAKIR